MSKAVKSGQLNASDLKNLLNSGIISQFQYNELLGYLLSLFGFNWKNTKPKPKDTGGCKKWNKDCGGDAGSKISEMIDTVMDIIKDFLGFYSRLLRYVSTVIYQSADGKLDGNPSNNSSDVSIIVNVLHFLIMIFPTVYFAYNWFYIMFYRDQLGQPIKIDFKNNVMESLKGILARLFKSLVQPMILLDAFMRLVIPGIYFKVGKVLKSLFIGPLDLTIIGKILMNPIFIFIALTFLILYMTCAYSGKLSDMLLSYIAGKKIPYDSYLYIIVLYDIFVGITSLSLIPKVFSFVEMLMNPLTTLFWFLVLLIFSLVMIRLGGLFCVMYLYAMSYLAIAIYSPSGWVGGINTVNEALEEATKAIGNNCPKGKWEKIIIDILNFIYKYLYGVLYIIILIYSIIWIFKDMKSSSGKVILGSAFSMILAVIIMTVYVMYLQNKTNIGKSEVDL